MKKIIISVLIILIVLFVLFFNTDKAKIIRGNIMYGKSVKCGGSESKTTDVTNRICHICLHSFEGSSSEILCKECSELTDRCRVCGKIKEVLYSTRYYYSMGSKNIVIYKNGEIYVDIETEEPNHKPKFNYLKTLNDEEIKKVENIIQNDSGNNRENIQKQVIDVIFGKSIFNRFLFENN